MRAFFVTIRPFCRADRPQLRKISYETSFAENPHGFIDDEEVVADALTVYFTDYEPESCFVAVCENQVVGYLTGAKNAVAMNRFSLKTLYPKLAVKCLRSPFLWRKNSWKFLAGCLMGFLKGEFRRPDFSKQYPAIFHINIEKNYRGSGVAQRLMEVYLKYLQDHKIRGVHCATLSQHANGFFEKLGFTLLFKGPRFFGKEGRYFILGKKNVIA